MHSLLTTVRTEGRLLTREPVTLFFALVFPTLLLAVVGVIPALRTADPQFGGLRFVDYFAPSIVVITLAMAALQSMPTILATYREQGVLRRLSVTPASPTYLLVAQLVLHVALATASMVLIAVGRVAFGIPLPQQPLGFAVAFVVSVVALFALGLVMAAVAPSARAATGIATLAFMVVLFFGGVYLPRFLLPSAVVAGGAYLPPGVQALLDGWIGDAPPPRPAGASWSARRPSRPTCCTCTASSASTTAPRPWRPPSTGVC